MKGVLHRYGVIMLHMLIFLCISASAMMAQEHEPDKGIKVIMSAFSGRPNPEWWLTSGAEFEELIRHIGDLRTEKKPLFNYESFNRLGIVTFWILPKNVEVVQGPIHVWKDMAYVLDKGQERNGMYALDATPIYDLLITQAQERNYGWIFERLRQLKETPQIPLPPPDPDKAE